MASPTRWAWIWVVSGSWWWAGRPGVLQFMESQRVRHDWMTEPTKWLKRKETSDGKSLYPLCSKMINHKQIFHSVSGQGHCLDVNNRYYWKDLPGGAVVKNLPVNAGTSGDTGSVPGLEDPLEEEITTHSSVLAWIIPWTQAPGRLQPVGRRVRLHWATEHARPYCWKAKLNKYFNVYYDYQTYDSCVIGC